MTATDGLWNILHNTKVKNIASSALLNSSNITPPSFDLSNNNLVTPQTLCHNLMD